ncbi:MAG: prepilin peptidase [Candidatus Marinimicrobia bacterium]|nr:prepilin peptidase [Candidatus Neomarinimicrobiota bacterium]
MNVLNFVFPGALGAISGSFLATVIYRLQRGISLVGRSKCPYCGCVIQFYRNVPILSFLFQKGRCAYCGHKISLLYPVVELVGMILWIWAFGCLDVENAILFVWVSSVLIVIGFIDGEYLKIPLFLMLLAACGIFVAVVVGALEWRMVLVGGVFAFVFLSGVRAMYYRIRGVEGLGFGDILLGTLIGGWLGVRGFLFVIIASSTMGLMWFILVSIRCGWDRNRKIPFGTFMSAISIFYVVMKFYFIK